MALEAHPHAPDFLRQPLQVLNRPVALLAGNLAVDVALMVEQHVFRHIIDFDPRGRCAFVEVAVFFLNPGVFGDNVIMAVQAFFHRRNSRKIGIGDIGMAVLALDLLDTAVDIVAEWDRLFRTNIRQRRPIEKVQKCTRKNQNEECQQYRYLIFWQRYFPC